MTADHDSVFRAQSVIIPKARGSCTDVCLNVARDYRVHQKRLAFGLVEADREPVIRSRHIACLLILLMLPFGFFGGSATVLCVGADGHVAIETGANGSCKGAPCDEDEHGHEHDGAGHDHEGCGHERDCCGDCQDVAIELEDGTHSQVMAELDAAFVFVAWMAVDITESSRLPSSLILPDRRHLLPHGPPLDSIRTVRLLI